MNNHKTAIAFENTANKKGILMSVVVVVKNGERTIKQCLDSLFNQNQPIEQYEVIVVDGGSTDGTLSLVQDYPIRLLIDVGGTIAHGRNVGVQAAEGDYIAFTDSDCVVQKDWLKVFFTELQNRTNVIAVGGPNLVGEFDPPLSKVIGYMQETFVGSGGSPQSYALKESKYVCSLANCNVMYRKKVLLEENFDNTFNVGEDCELNYRLAQKGCSFLYFPNAFVWHSRPQSFRKFFKKMFSYGDAMAKVSKKHKRLVRWFAPIPLIALFALIFGFLLLSVYPTIAYVGLAVFSFYGIILLIPTIKVYSRYPCRTALFVILLLPLQHIAYASGFLKGVLGR